MNPPAIITPDACATWPPPSSRAPGSSPRPPDARGRPLDLAPLANRPPRRGPPFIRLSSRVTLYGAHDVRRWLAARRIDPGQAA